MTAIRNNEKVYMRAYSTAGGGVMFVPDALERKVQQTPVISYQDFHVEEKLTTRERMDKIALKIAEIRAKTAKACAAA